MSMTEKTKAALTWWAIASFLLVFWGAVILLVYDFATGWW